MAPPTVALALTPTVLSDFLPRTSLERLARTGRVVVEPDALHHRHPASWAVLADADVVVTGWGTARLDDDLLAAMPRLRAVVHTGGSVRALVPGTVHERGVRVSSQTALNAVPVAEYAAAMVMLCAKQTLRSARVYRQLRGPVDRSALFAGSGTFGTTVGLVGLSRISRHVAGLLAPLDLDVVMSSQWLTDDEAARLGVRRVALDDLLRTSRVVSLHSASLSRTRHLLGAREFALMPDGATFVNTARGDVVDQQALVAELARGRLDAVLDVTDPDVTVPDSPLWDLPNVLLTPHFAGATGNELHRLGLGAVHDVENLFAGLPMAGEIGHEQFAGIA